MNGGRELLTCPACEKRFTYWTLKATAQPKVVCTFCEKEWYPKGEPPAAEPPPAPAPKAAAAPKAEPAKAG